MKINVFLPWYSWKIAELALNNNHSLTEVKFYKVLNPTNHYFKKNYIYTYMYFDYTKKNVKIKLKIFTLILWVVEHNTLKSIKVFIFTR